MKILLIGSFKHEMYAPAFSYGFKQLGHEVIEIDYERYHSLSESIWASYLNRIQDRFHFGLRIKKYNNDITRMVNMEHPDVVFLYRCYRIYNTTLSTIRKQAFVFSYNNDDPFSCVPSKFFYRYHIKNAYLCHLNYVYRKKNIEDYSKIGITNTKVLLPYYISHQNVPINCFKDIPLAFLGHFENDGRDKKILILKDAGLPVVVFGDEKWKESPLYERIKDVVFPAKRGKEYNETINRCRICLVFFSKLNHDTYTRRCFEIPATKTVMLCEYSDDMNSLFPEGKCAVYYKNDEELVIKAMELINDPDRVNMIANNAYDRLHFLGGSEIDRCKEIVSDITKLES